MAVSSGIFDTGFQNTDPPPNQLALGRPELPGCSYVPRGQWGFCICATRLMPDAQNRGSSSCRRMPCAPHGGLRPLCPMCQNSITLTRNFSRTPARRAITLPSGTARIAAMSLLRLVRRLPSRNVQRPHLTARPRREGLRSSVSNASRLVAQACGNQSAARFFPPPKSSVNAQAFRCAF